MNSTCPSISESLGTGVGLSVAGPIAGTVLCLVREGIGAKIDLEGSCAGGLAWDGSEFRAGIGGCVGDAILSLDGSIQSAVDETTASVVSVVIVSG